MNGRIVLGFTLAAAVIALAVLVATVGVSQEPREASVAAARTIGVDQQRADPFDIVFDRDTVRSYRILIDDDAWAQLQSDPTAERYVPAAVDIDCERYEPVGVRYKGFFGVLRACFVGGRQVCPKLSWKLKFNEYEPSLRFHGLKRLNFHAMGGDEAQMREVLTYEVFRDAGVVAPRSVYARLELNGKPLGLFTLTEDIDDVFVRDRFRDRGRGILYKEVWPGNTDALWPHQAALADAIVRGKKDPDGMIRFTEAVNAAETDEARFQALLPQLQDEVDIFNYLAADRLTDNWDGIVGWYCVPECLNHNYFWYQDGVSGGFTLIPWDVEHTWRGVSPIREYYGMPDWDDLHRSCRMRKVFWDLDARAPHCDPILRTLAAQGWERYIDASRRLMRETISLEIMHQRVERLADLIDPHIAADANGPGYGAWRAAVDSLHAEIDERWRYIDDKIRAWDANDRS